MTAVATRMLAVVVGVAVGMAVGEGRAWAERMLVQAWVVAAAE